MTDKKKFVFNIYEVGKREIDKGEINLSPTLVDRTEKVPTLEEYLKNYSLGASVPFVDNGSEFEDEDEEFKVQDFRNVDIEVLKEENHRIFKEYEEAQKKQKEIKIQKKVKVEEKALELEEKDKEK